MPDRPKEPLDQFRHRVTRLEVPRLTSNLYSKAGWPIFGIGVVLWLIQLLVTGIRFLPSLLALLLIGLGAASVAMSLFSAQSEGVEEAERARRIRERSSSVRCLYLEGKVPDGKGAVGWCRLYEFDMVDLPYCLYCKEYVPSKGSPEV